MQLWRIILKSTPFIFSSIGMCWKKHKGEDPAQSQDIHMPKISRIDNPDVNLRLTLTWNIKTSNLNKYLLHFSEIISSSWLRSLTFLRIWRLWVFDFLINRSQRYKLYKRLNLIYFYAHLLSIEVAVVSNYRLFRLLRWHVIWSARNWASCKRF